MMEVYTEEQIQAVLNHACNQVQEHTTTESADDATNLLVTAALAHLRNPDANATIEEIVDKNYDLEGLGDCSPWDVVQHWL